MLGPRNSGTPTSMTASDGTKKSSTEDILKVWEDHFTALFSKPTSSSQQAQAIDPGSPIGGAQQSSSLDVTSSNSGDNAPPQTAQQSPTPIFLERTDLVEARVRDTQASHAIRPCTRRERDSY